MAAPTFGFSFGDFIAGIGLVRDLVTALQDGARAKLQFRHPITELMNLERALTEVRFLKVDDYHISQKRALEQIAVQCQESIEDFLRRNAKFNTTLGTKTTFSKWSWRVNLHKIQWAMCQEDAVDKLRANIMGHTLTINTLLATIHLSVTALQTESTKSNQIDMKEHRKVTNEAQSLAKQNHNLLSTQADLIFMISQNIASCSTYQQAENLQLVILKVLDTNMKIYKIVSDIQTLQFQLPPQVDHQQPVYFEDAHGRIAPFYTEFISSFDAFQAVMEVRFYHVPGLKKVHNIEYTIQDSSSKRKLDLTASWDFIFLPGRTMTMSMVFRRPNIGSEIQCPSVDCKMWYQRIVEVDMRHKAPLGTSKIQQGKRRRVSQALIVVRNKLPKTTKMRTRYTTSDGVYVVHKNPVLTSPLPSQRKYSSSMTDSVPSGSEILAGDPSPLNEDMQPNIPQIYTAVYSKILMYEMEINGVAVMRRSSDSWLNATQVLKVAGIDKIQRAEIIEREVLTGEHEKIQGGYGKSQGVWISYERGVELCRQYGVEEQLRPLLGYDISQDGASIAGRGVGTPTKEEVMATWRRRSYHWTRAAKSWPGPQSHTTLTRTANYHSLSYTTAKRVTTGSIMRRVGGHMSDSTLSQLTI